MEKVEKIDQYIFWCMLGFAFTTCINHIVGNQILGVTVLLGLVRWYKERPIVKLPKEYYRALMVFFSIMFLSIFTSPDILESAKEFWRYTNRMFPFLLILFFIKNKKELWMIFAAFLISMTINNTYAVYKGLLLVVQGQSNLRVTGFESGVILFSGHLLLAIPILAILWGENKEKKWNQYLVATLSVSMMALLLNGTRIVWVISAMLLPIIFFIYAKNLKSFFMLICIVAGAVGITGYTMPFMQTRIMSFVDHKDVSNQGHYLIARDSLELIKEHPLLGVGLGRFKESFHERYRSEEHFKLEQAQPPHAHNNTLMILAETGIVGCIAFWFMFGSFLYYSGKQWYQTRNACDLMFLMITLATVMQGITDFSFGLNQVVKIYFAMLAIYLNYRYSEGKFEMTSWLR